MKKNTRTLIITIVSFVAIIIIASIAYKALRESAEPVAFTPQMVVPGTTTSSEAVISADSQAVEPKSAVEESQIAVEAGQETEPSSEIIEEVQAEPEVVQEEDVVTEESEEPRMPDIPFYTLDGVETSFEKIREGKPVVINYWASWCPPCKEELPHFQKAYDTYGDQISFIFLNALDGQQETLQTVTKFIEDFKFTGPVYYDKGLFAYIFQTNSLPTTVFFNADGTVAGGQLGYMSEEALQRNIDLLLK